MFWGRVSYKIFLHAAAGFAAYIMVSGDLPHFKDSAWILFGVYSFLTGVGVTLNMHRLLTHQAFVCKSGALRWVLMVSAAMAGQGTEASWVPVHSVHHQNSDEPGDPHTPLHFYPIVYDRAGKAAYNTELPFWGRLWRSALGLFWAHFVWAFFPFPESVQKQVDAQKEVFLDTTKRGLAPERVRDIQIALWQQSAKVYFALLVIPGFLFPGLMGGLAEGLSGGISDGLLGCAYAILLAGFFRIVVVYHVTASVNSIGHVLGDEPRYACGHPYEKTNARNARNVLIMILSFGERGHGNHHFAPRSAHFHRVFDPGKWLLCLFEKLGLVSDVYVPTRRFCPQCRRFVVEPSTNSGRR